jgi:hypothetical protein
MKIWPLRIQVALQDARSMISDKNEIFNNNLEKEKEKFAKDIAGYMEDFEKIKGFTNLSQSGEFSTNAYTLKENISNAFEKKKQYNEREMIFNQPETMYPELETLNTDFTPFFNLTTMAYLVKTELNDWTNNALSRQDPKLIEDSVGAWL